jgi:uncharacterized membrane-anchored protein YhcB (DUF1043 family)
MKATITNTKDTANKHSRKTTIFNTSLGKDYRYLYQHLSIDDLDYVKDKPKYKHNKTDMNDSTDSNDSTNDSNSTNESIDSNDTNDSINE